ncbi:beta-lactamase [Solidesulfovibrio carbinoliphilus subsp. oakridgensis]|uniref:Beta-lactamase n=1 Tax=Solidesulfovibrio carbinoliphilus subsp. oakridgensis TaxID=694327 RepID=G7Q5N2_9BACT|nr:serine hydrolase domain-containing protein [Solidesulfovibrio carbinoliphilus]EHJ49591.1 beta-lactamase [Solidesulfovibrio carbinoliphilus subsp. oakridgensis]
MPRPSFSLPAALVVLLALLLGAGPPARAAGLPGRQATAQVVARLTESGRVHGLVVGYVSPAGRVVHGFGRAGEGRRSGAPDGRTLFEIGSITKTFTGLLLAQAVMAGRVRATDPIRLDLPAGTLGKESPLAPVSYLDLATHASGLPEGPDNLPSRDPQNPLAGYSTGLLLDYLARARPIAPVGRDFFYSNVGAGLCGYLMARLAGTDYETLVKHKVCEPLAMADTTITLSAEQAGRMTHGHDAKGRIVPNWDVTGLEGAGALRSTADDLLTYAAANMGLLPTPLLPAMKLAQLPRKHVSSIPTLFLGFFWNIMNFGGKEYLLHAGRSGGYFALVLLSPEDNAGIVLLCDTEGDFTKEGWRLLELATGKDLP